MITRRGLLGAIVALIPSLFYRRSDPAAPFVYDLGADEHYRKWSKLPENARLINVHQAGMYFYSPFGADPRHADKDLHSEIIEVQGKKYVSIRVESLLVYELP